MPSRHHNIYEDGAVCFWTSAIVRRVPVFSSRTAARALTATLDECRKRCDVKLLGYVIMPDHVHLAVWSADSRKVTRFLQQFLAISSSRIAALAERATDRGDGTAAAWLAIFKASARKGRAVRVWKERGRAFPVSRHDGLVQKLNYIHANPVRSQLTLSAEDWEFSSARWYAEEKGPLTIDLLDG